MIATQERLSFVVAQAAEAHKSCYYSFVKGQCLVCQWCKNWLMTITIPRNASFERRAKCSLICAGAQLLRLRKSRRSHEAAMGSATLALFGSASLRPGMSRARSACCPLPNVSPLCPPPLSARSISSIFGVLFVKSFTASFPSTQNFLSACLRAAL